MYLFRAGQSVELDFNTNKFSDGTLVTFTGGAVKMFRGSDTTGSNTGLTLTIDANSVTGENHITIAPVTAAAYLLPGNVFTVRVTTADSGAQIPVGTIVAIFKVERMSAGIEYVLSANATTGGTATDNGLLAGADVGDIVTVESGSYPGQPRTITAWNKSTGVFTVSPNFDNAPGNVTVTVYPQAPIPATLPTVNVTQINGGAVPSSTATGIPKVEVAYVAGQGPLKTAGVGGQSIGT